MFGKIKKSPVTPQRRIVPGTHNIQVISAGTGASVMIARNPEINVGDFILTQRAPMERSIAPSSSNEMSGSSSSLVRFPFSDRAVEKPWCISEVVGIGAEKEELGAWQMARSYELYIGKFTTGDDQGQWRLPAEGNYAWFPPSTKVIKVFHDKDEAHAVGVMLAGVSGQIALFNTVLETIPAIFRSLDNNDFLAAKNIAHEHEKLLSVITSPCQEFGVKLKLFDRQ